MSLRKSQPKLAYQALPDGIKGTVKAAINSLLNRAGFEISSTLKQRIENGRLRGLQVSGHWQREKYTQGLELDDQRALQFLREICIPYQTQYNSFAPAANGDERQYFLNNGWFESVDAEILYSVLRHFQPDHVLEVGSGFSTRVMRRAINDGKLSTRITSIDPLPNTDVQPYADKYLKARVEDIEVEEILRLLSPGDILFIDSSHTIQTGGDVPYLFLEVLPRLQAGVLVHIHDIFFPFDYPSDWVMDGWGWNEQYLVHAFLAGNKTFEILWPARYLWERQRAAIVEFIPSAAALTRQPSSLWLRKVA